ncbi:hypothetical protein VTH8203_03052 [Vibrio thalassae]|uniref:PPIase cyclophilin-type domain-containing protein n=1 Tax=Vibrio thalassae TaxID=1243014 RepID=A0A240EN33_9VIBR|nr:hypothetical protein VTH8203_03052 [Vibrio thalassae]
MTTITLKTNLGNIDIELNIEKAPVSAKNFSNIASKVFIKGRCFIALLMAL